MANPQTINQIKQAIIESIREQGKKAYLVTQQKTPVDTGFLRASGLVEDLDNGVMLQYKADYADVVERGSKAGPRHVPSYFRKDGTYVRAYDYYASARE